MKVTRGLIMCTRYFAGFLAFLLPFIFFLDDIAHASGYRWRGSVSAEMAAPTAIAFDGKDNLYVVESSKDRLLVYSSGGRHVKDLGGLDRPVSVAVDEAGRVLIGNAGRGNVEVYGRDFRLLRKLGEGDGEFGLPSSIAIDGSGNIYVADSKDDVVRVYTSKGAYKGTLGPEGSFHVPTCIAIHKKSGDLVISDLPVIQGPDGPTGGARLQIFSSTGRLKRSFGEYGQGDGKLTKPMGVAVDASWNIYVTDSYQNIVQVFDKYGKSLGAMHSEGNPMRTPMGIAISAKGKYYIASLNTGKVEVFSMRTQ